MQLRTMEDCEVTGTEERITTQTAWHTTVHGRNADRSGEVRIEEDRRIIIQNHFDVIVSMKDQAVAGSVEKDLQVWRCHSEIAEGAVYKTEVMTTETAGSTQGRRRTP